MSKGATALKKINARVKQLAKRHPGKKRTTLQKQAGKEYREGKLKHASHRKAHPKKRRRAVSGRKRVHRHKRKRVGRLYHVMVAGRSRRTHRKKRVGRRRRSRVLVHNRVVKRYIVRRRPHRVAGRRRVSGIGKTLMPVLIVGFLAFLVWMLFKPKAVPPLVTTANATRNNQAASILTYAQAAGATLAGLTKLIEALNSSSDSQVAAMQTQIQAQTNLSDDSAVQSIINQSTSSGMLAGYPQY